MKPSVPDGENQRYEAAPCRNSSNWRWWAAGRARRRRGTHARRGRAGENHSGGAAGPGGEPGMSQAAERSFEKITMDDLMRLAKLALDDLADFFARRPETGALYQDR